MNFPIILDDRKVLVKKNIYYEVYKDKSALHILFAKI